MGLPEVRIKYIGWGSACPPVWRSSRECWCTKLNNIVLLSRAAAAKHVPKRKINISLNVNYILNIFNALPSKGKNINFTLQLLWLHLVCLCHCVTSWNINPLKCAANTNCFIHSFRSALFDFMLKLHIYHSCGCSVLLPHHKPDRFDSLLSHQLFC